MIFDTATITDDGFTLLLSAAAGEKIIWGTCKCAVDENGTFPVAKGYAVSSYKSASTDVAYITCSMDNTQSGCVPGNANYFLLYAKKEGDLSEVLAVRAHVGEHTPTQFPQYNPQDPDGTSLRGIVDFNIQLVQGVISEIDMTVSAYALASDLQKLSERVVTTHTVDSTTAGDNQTIYGDKKFKNDVTANGNFYVFNDGETKLVTSGGEAGECVIELIAGDGEDLSKVTISAESPDRYTDIQMYDGCVFINVENDGKCQINGTLTAEVAKLDELVVSGSAVFNYDGEPMITLIGSELRIDADVEVANSIIPSLSNSINLGSNSKKFHYLYSTGIQVFNINVGTQETGFTAINSNYAEFKTGMTIHGALNVDGGIPSLCSESNSELDVGAIAIVIIKKISSEYVAISNKKAGEFITDSELTGHSLYMTKTSVISSNYQESTGSANFYDSSHSRQLSIPSGMKLKLICDFVGTPIYGTDYIAIVMRTE